METTIHWANFIIDPSLAPPFNVECGLISNYEVVSKITYTLFNCQNIGDASDKIIALCNEREILLHKNFTLIYPIYQNALGTEHEDTMNEIAEYIMEEAEIRGWKFARIGGLTGLSEGNFFMEQIEIKENTVKKEYPPLAENMVFKTYSSSSTDPDRALSRSQTCTITVLRVENENVILNQLELIVEDKFDSDYKIYTTSKEYTQQFKGRISVNTKDDCVRIDMYEPYSISYYLNTELHTLYTDAVK